MKPTRRNLLAGTALGLGAAPALARPSLSWLGKTPGRLLVLGGTRFLGPQIVQAALDAGWEVTLFNRGRSNPELFQDLEQRIGDRNTRDLSALAEGEWDAAIDTSAYVPAHVDDSCRLLADRVKHYVLVSTISVYEDSEEPVVGEDAPLGQVPEERLGEFDTIQSAFVEGGRFYGPLKALCEQAAERAMPGRVSNVRPGLIVGPGDGTDRFTYWPVRVSEGGEVLAPGDPDVGIQVIDVRDLGAWCFDLAARKVGGIFNAVGFRSKITMQELLHGAKLVAGSDAHFTWVPDDFLLEQEVGPWMELPLWIPGGGNHFTNERAFANGMPCRPLAETIRATLDWHLAERGAGYTWPGAGLARDKEARVLAAWRERER